MTKKTVLAIIVPCFNEEAVLDYSNKKFLSILHELIKNGNISEESYICYVNDGSSDKTWDLIKTFKSQSRNVKGISFSKNFGHQSAMYAGLVTCTADAFITIDADMQEDPEMIKEMVEKYHEGNKVVYGVRKERKDKFFKKYFAKLFYSVMNIVGSGTIPNQSEVRLLDKEVVEHLKKYPEKNIYLRGMIQSIGFKTALVYYSRVDRYAGETKYSFYKLIKTALNGITTTSSKPLEFISLLGMVFMGISVLLFLLAILGVFLNFSNIMVYILLFAITFIGSIQLLSIGIIAEYIGRIFIETKGRPVFIIEEDLTK